MNPNLTPVDFLIMDEKKDIDVASEPVDLEDDGIVDTGVLHELADDEDEEDD